MFSVFTGKSEFFNATDLMFVDQSEQINRVHQLLRLRLGVFHLRLAIFPIVFFFFFVLMPVKQRLFSVKSLIFSYNSTTFTTKKNRTSTGHSLFCSQYQ